MMLLAVKVAAQAPAGSTTTIEDVIYRADGTAASGTLVISWPEFTSANNLAVAAGTMAVPIGAEGAISLALVPNAGATPDGIYYKVVFKLDDGTTSEEYWSVPATTTTTISAIRSKIVPSAVAIQVASRQYVDTAIATALAGFHGPFPLVVTSFNGRTGDVVAAANDYAYSQLRGIPSTFNAGQLQGANLDPPTGTGQQPTYNGTKFVEQAKQAADFRDFGAVGNLIADDTSAANTAVASLATNGGSIQIPGSANSFWMKLTSPLNVSNIGNYDIGGGSDSTGFAYCGDGTGPVVNADNAYNLSFQNLAIYGHWRDGCTTTYATAGISWDKTGTSGWTATRLALNRLTITAAPQGDISTPNFTCVDISPTSLTNVEDGRFYNVTCTPGGGIGFHIGPSDNAKNEIFFNNNVSFGQYGYKFEAGGYHIKYGEVGNLTNSALWFTQANDPVSVDGLLSEANKQFLQLGPSFGPVPITLSHINNGWDSQATAPCFWDIGGAQYFLAFSNTWSDTSFATPHAICGNSSSSGMFINNSFAWKVGGASGGLYEMMPPPADIQQLLGPSYGFYQGGNIVVGSVNATTNNGLSFIQSTGGTREGLRILENPIPRIDGAIPVANDNPYLGDGAVEVAGPGAATVLPGCTVTGGDTSTGYTFWMFAKDGNGRRTTEAHTFCNGPATLDSNHQMTFQWVGTPGSQSYDVMFLVSGLSCFIGNTTATSIAVSAMPTCDNSYVRPTQNEAEYVNLRGKGVYAYGPASAVSPSWSIDNAAGVASFSGGVSAPNVSQLCMAANAQTCINALAVTGGTVYLGPDTYTGAITLPDNGNCVNLVGAGVDVTFLTVNASATAVVSKGNSSLPLNCRITDLTVDGNLQASYGLQLLKGKGWQIQRVKVKRVLATTGEGIQLGEASGSAAEFYEARIRDVSIAFESSDYAASARPLNGLHFLTTASDNQISDVTAWNMTNAGIVDDAGDNQYNKVHVYGFPVLTYYPNYAMEVLGNAHVTQLTADGVNTGGVHVRGNGNSVTNSTFQWPSGGQVSGAFPVAADAGTDYNVYRDNVVRSGSGLSVNSVAAVFATIGGNYYPGNNTEIAGNLNYNDSTDGAFVAFYPLGFHVFGEVTPNSGYTFVTPFSSKPTIAARVKTSGQTADLFDCLATDDVTKLCSIDVNGNATFASINGALPKPTASTLGGIESIAAVSHQWINSISTSGVPSTTQPGFSDLSGNIAVSQMNGGTSASASTFWRGDGTWATVSGSGGGTVSSVGLSLPSIFSVSGSPVTSSGTLTGTLATESANTIFAGPSSGSAAAPTFRALTGADLPNPSSSTLGGVESYAAVAHQWINSISTSGVPASTQPACGDLSNSAPSCSTDTTNASNISSGTLAAARLPNPSSSTLGGIESYAAVSHQWLSSISTSGVPSSTQPGFSDISGSLACSQHPALTGDTTSSAGGCATTTSGINGASVPTSAAIAATNSSKQIVAAATTGSGSTAVLATSPTITNPTLQEPVHVGAAATTQLSAPSAPTIAQGGTAGSTSYTYAVVCKDQNGGGTAASSTTQTTAGNATLSSSNYNTVSWSAGTGCSSYDVYRTASSGTPSSTGWIGNTTSSSLNDTGLTGNGNATPTVNTTGSTTGVPNTAANGIMISAGLLNASNIAQQTGQAVSGSNNQLMCFQFYLPIQFLAGHMTWKSGSTATGTVDFGIYDANKNKVVDAGAITVSTSTVYTQSFTQVTLIPGWYWFCQVASSSTTLSAYNLNGGSFSSSFINAQTVHQGTAANSFGSSLPQTLGTMTSSAAANQALVVWEY